MPDLIRYYSTNRNVPPATLAEALLQGQAADRGLFLPERFPQLTAADLKSLAGRPYCDVAFAVLRRTPPACSMTRRCGRSATMRTTSTCRSST